MSIKFNGGKIVFCLPFFLVCARVVLHHISKSGEARYARAITRRIRVVVLPRCVAEVMVAAVARRWCERRDGGGYYEGRKEGSVMPVFR